MPRAAAKQPAHHQDHSAGTTAVIGAGSSGLAVLKALREQGIAIECFERGSEVGGNWRYQNDSGFSSAYASLRTNVSRERMQYPSFPMPSSHGDFPHHSQMAAYLAAYADRFRLTEHIRFGVAVERLEPRGEGGWRLSFDDGAVSHHSAVVIATGIHWCPKLPAVPGVFAGEAIHSHDYRTPEPFAGRRILVVGAGQSAVEVALEVARAAECTAISVRSGAHVIPRRIGAEPYDVRDVEPFVRAPWRLMNSLFARSVDRELGSVPPSWPAPSHRVLEGNPTVSSDLFPALRSGEIEVKPEIERLAGELVRFADGDEEPFDVIIYATGYSISLPFLSPSLLASHGRELPLYRRIVPPGIPGLFLAGFVDAPGGLLSVVEEQGEWIGAVLSDRLRLPGEREMWKAVDRAERRTRQRFPGESPRSTRCDPHAYRRLLRSDGRRALRCFGLTARGAPQAADGCPRADRQRAPYRDYGRRRTLQPRDRASAFITKKTVEAHVSNAYRKLDLRAVLLRCQQVLGLGEVGRREAFGEGPVNGSQHAAPFVRVRPPSRQAVQPRCGPQLRHPRVEAAGEVECVLETALRTRGAAAGADR
jgi:cation diffusion facilitator CzcD-associated flavoprotein CzcO